MPSTARPGRSRRGSRRPRGRSTSASCRCSTGGRWTRDSPLPSRSPTASARAVFAGTGREVRVNLAARRTPKPHVTIKYLGTGLHRPVPERAARFGTGWQPRHRVRGQGDDPQRRDRGFRVGDRAAAGRVHASAVVGDPGAAAGADGDPDPVPGPGGNHQGPQVPHHLDLRRRPGRAARLPAARPGSRHRRIGLATAATVG